MFTRLGILKSTLIALSVLIAASFSHAAPITLSGTGTAAIDGVISLDEWDSAATFDLLVNTPGGGTTNGRFLVMNDTLNIYFGLFFDRNTADPGNSFSIEFDNDGSGNLSEGDDGIIVNPTIGFSDLYRSNNFGCPSNINLCSFRDIDIGGSLDGAGAFSNDGTHTIYEMSHALDSGDLFDFSLSPGDIIGLTLHIRMIEQGANFPDGFGDTRVAFGSLEYAVSRVPEPTTLALVSLGFVGFGFYRKRKMN